MNRSDWLIRSLLFLFWLSLSILGGYKYGATTFLRQNLEFSLAVRVASVYPCLILAWPFRREFGVASVYPVIFHAMLFW